MEKVSSAYSWGKNKDGELSVGTNCDVFLPQSVRGLKNKQLKYIASGCQHSACIDIDGQLYICGSSLHGKLGIEDLGRVSIPSFNHIKSLQGKKVKQVSCGDYHTLCLLEDGSVYTWGGTLHKKLGQQPTSERGKTRPGIIESFKGKHILYVDCGDFHSAALGSDGKIYTWGGGGVHYNKGQCGHGHSNDVNEPTAVQALKKKSIVKISCGGYHTLALTSDNELFAFGGGLTGECGFGEFLNTHTPKLVNFPWTKKKLEEAQYIIQISGGGHHSLVLTSVGQVFAFGFASYGQLGLHNTINQSEPQLVSDLRNKSIKSVATGWNHSLVLTRKGDVWACGYGFYGQLGLGDDEPRTSFSHIASLGEKKISEIYAGGNHSWAILNLSDSFQEDYEPPSPLADNSFSSSMDRPELLSYLSSAAQVSEFELTIAYGDHKYCHRFISYTLKEASIEIGKVRAEEFVHEMYIMEKGLEYHRIQQDNEIYEVDDDIQQVVCSGGNLSFTIGLVCDPAKNEPPLTVDRSVKNNDDDVVVKKESYELYGRVEESLSEWVRFFMSKVGNFCKKPPVFFEMRHYSFM